MNDNDITRITDLLERIRNGDAAAERELFELVYDDLKSRASLLMAKERKPHTFTTRDLVHSVYTKLAGKITNVVDQQHLLKLSTKAMQNFLRDHARKKLAPKRGGDRERLPLDVVLADFEAAIGRELGVKTRGEAVLDALNRLNETHPRVCEGIRLRFFCNYTKVEAAKILGVAESTVDNDWVVGRTRLRMLLEEAG